jgi:hypothetical protein
MSEKDIFLIVIILVVGLSIVRARVVVKGSSAVSE